MQNDPAHKLTAKDSSPWLVFCLLALVAVGGVVGAWLLPPLLVQAAADGGKLPTAVRVAEVSSARQSILFAAGGLIALITLGFTWHRDQISKQVAEVQRDSQYTERYTRAVDQLGRDDSLAMRLGGIGALERLARESTVDREYIAQLLSRWIRGQTADDNDYVVDNRPHERLDLRAAVEAYMSLTRHSLKASDALQGADLRGVDFRGLDLSGIDLTDADLRGAQFLDADLTGAKLQRARMDNATFGTTAVLNAADLRHASLTGAAMSGTSFVGTDLDGADFTDADLRATPLAGARSIKGTVLRRTLLSDGSLPQPDSTTVFDGADLSGAIFTGDLTDVDLSGARIDMANFSGTRNTRLAKLPTELGELYARNWPADWRPEGYWPDA